MISALKSQVLRKEPGAVVTPDQGATDHHGVDAEHDQEQLDQAVERFFIFG
jgi:hypothetical protein